MLVLSEACRGLVGINVQVVVAVVEVVKTVSSPRGLGLKNISKGSDLIYVCETSQLFINE